MPPAWIDNYVLAKIPEPGTLVLLATGLIGLLCYAWRKRK
ncbi:MAG: PEP-CTERM sorting domain-containing protein [Pirellulales bacterium]|nr:PEP-CTERM sorting domain-containing protein [Pirellulales bacterium]